MKAITLATSVMILFAATVSLGATCKSNTSGAGRNQFTVAPSSVQVASTKTSSGLALSTTSVKAVR